MMKKSYSCLTAYEPSRPSCGEINTVHSCEYGAMTRDERVDGDGESGLAHGV